MEIYNTLGTNTSVTTKLHIDTAAWCLLESRRDYTQPADPHHLSLLECIAVVSTAMLRHPCQYLKIKNRYKTAIMKWVNVVWVYIHCKPAANNPCPHPDNRKPNQTNSMKHENPELKQGWGITLCSCSSTPYGPCGYPVIQAARQGVSLVNGPNNC